MVTRGLARDVAKRANDWKLLPREPKIDPVLCQVVQRTQVVALALFGTRLGSLAAGASMEASE